MQCNHLTDLIVDFEYINDSTAKWNEKLKLFQRKTEVLKKFQD